MTNTRAIELLKIERECVNRNNQPFGKNCSRECGKCDLVQNTDELLEMYDFVIDVMEKQIPKEPCYSGDGYYNGEIVIDTWECPCCGKEYEVDYDDYEYCPNCGQHIDHSTLTEDD